MSRRKHGRRLCVSRLKQRGWTMELIDALHPKPRYVLAGGKSIRVWEKKDVLAAELTPQFAAGRVVPPAPILPATHCAKPGSARAEGKRIDPRTGSWPGTTTPRSPGVSPPPGKRIQI